MFPVMTKIKSDLMMRYRGLDKTILYGAFILMVCGFFLILAAGPAVAKRTHYPTFHFVIRQALWAIPTLIVMLGVAMLPVKRIRQLSGVILIGGILCMIYILLFAARTKGAARWINIGPIGLQPSEFVKPVFAVVCAWLLASGRLIKKFPGYTIAFILYIVIGFLLFKQPDFGMLLTVTAIFGVQLFLSGISWLLIGGLGIVGAGILPIAYLTLDHVRYRLDHFFGEESSKGYQVEKSLETLQNAGWFGKGPGEGIVKYELPDAHTDFIFAVSAEEFGFILTAFLIGVFAVVILRGFWLVRKENNYFCQIAVAGLLTQIAFQVMVNMGSTLNMIPTKGMTLPFISYGGSSLVSMGLAFGFILGLIHSRTLSRGLE
ncbi:MAG: putative peptidoglycan glycosyltransferase FtsW [Pseudomonadota bacterium]|nr:putative peptidoglycan glycosyltransferase FtsW [Pseudomonadota bacterium]